MKQSIDFISKTKTGNYAKVDASRLAAAGMSCGGTEAYGVVDDARVKALGIFNSGQLSPQGTQNVVTKIRKPTFFFLGGPSDIAYENGMRDYGALPQGTPAWVGNLPVGHGGTYGDVNGGKFGKAAQQWARWVLKGDDSVKGYFTQGARADGWTVASKSLDRIVSL